MSAECHKRRIPVEEFINEDGPSERAVQACEACPVRLACLAFGMRTGSVGLFGGEWLELPDES